MTYSYRVAHGTRRRAVIAYPLCGIGATAWAQPAPRRPGEVLVGGTGAGLTPLQRAVEREGRLRFVPSLGTGGGLKAVLAGAIDIALAARPLSDDERSVGLVGRELFRSPYAWAVHAGVALRRASLAELAAIYAGRTTSWASGQPVRLVLRPEGDSDTRYLRTLSGEFNEAMTLAHARPGVQVAATDGEAVESLERIAGALGITTLGMVLGDKRRVHLLAVDGMEPSVEALARGRYRHAKTVYLVTRGAPLGAAGEMVQLLQAKATAQALAEVGCLSSSVA